MQAEVKQKTFLERIADTLPEPIREAYEAAPRRNSEAHEILRLLVAKHLWNNGYRDISFETPVNRSHEENMCVDIHERTLGLFIECERFPDGRAVSDRRRAIMDVYPTAKFVLATQDRMGWRALKLCGAADEVWVVCRDGRVLTPAEWAEERSGALKSVFSHVELEGYMNFYRKAEEDYQEFKRLSSEEELLWRQMLTLAYRRVSQLQAEWLNGISLKGVWSKHVEDAKKRMEEAKTKIISKVVGLLDAILSLSSPYRIRLAENGVLTVDVDWDAWQWLGWKDHPSKTPHAADQYKLLEENLQKELKIAMESKNRSFKECAKEIKQTIEQDRTLEELAKQIEEVAKEVEEIIPLLAQSSKTA